MYNILIPRAGGSRCFFPARKLTLTPGAKNFQGANVWEPGRLRKAISVGVIGSDLG